MLIGRKIYFEIATGNVVLDTGEREGAVVETTKEQDFESYLALNERNPETVGVIKLDYGQFAEDFAQSNGYRVNPETKQLEFYYRNPNDPAPEQPVFQKPLSDEVVELRQAVAELTMLMAAAPTA